MPDPKVSVVIPSYNSAHCVGDAIQSIIDQTYANWEVVVVDDGSADDTEAAVQRFRADPRIRYIRQENRGLPGARNAGARAATGDYLAFLDADDLLERRALELMVGAAISHNAQWCICNVVLRRNGVDEIVQTRLPDDAFRHLLAHDFIARAPFFRRDAFNAIGMYDELMLAREDWDINIRAMEHGLPFILEETPLYIYQVAPTGISRNSRKMLTYTERILNKHHRRLAAHDPQVRRILADSFWDLARRWLYQVRDYRRAFVCAAKSIMWDRSPVRLIRALGFLSVARSRQ
jgi:glycosyltransferase involved in cell wall biosynthesis